MSLLHGQFKIINIPKRTAGYVAILIIYFIIVISLSLPIPQNLISSVLGGESLDLNGHLWYYWFTKKCILNLDFTSICHTDFIAYPSGKNLLFDIGQPLLATLSIPFQIALKFPLYYNLFVITIVAMNGLACFLLLNYIYKDSLAAFIGGLFFSINPYVFYQINLGRPEQTAIFWMPFFILFLLKMRDEKNKNYPTMGSLLLALISLSYWYYGIFLLIFTTLFLSYSLFIKKERILSFVKNTLLLLFFYGVLMLLIFSYPVLIQGIHPTGYELVKPSLKDIVLQKVPVYFQYMITFTSLHCIPRSFLIISAIFAILSLLNAQMRKNNLFCIITAGFFFILSLGPYLTISHHVVILPYIFLYYVIPFFSRLWWPINCFSVILVCVAILLAAFIHWLRSKINSATKIIFPVILVVMYLLPYYNAQYNIVHNLAWLKMQAFIFSKVSIPHEVYYYLKEQQNCAIIELPFEKGPIDFFYNQIVHEKKVFNCPGYAIKEIVWPKNHLQYLRSNAFLRYLDLLFSYNSSISMPPYQNIPNEQSLKTGLKQLYNVGFRFIVVNPCYFKGYESKNWLINELKKILKKPYKEYPDGVLLYRIEDLIYE